MNDEYAHRRLAELCDDLHPLCPCDLNPATTDGPVQDCPVHGDGATFVAEVQALRAAHKSLPAPARWHTGPDEHGRNMSVPVWDDDLLSGITPWSEVVEILSDYIQYATAEQVEAAGLALLAVAKHMRASASISSPIEEGKS